MKTFTIQMARVLPATPEDHVKYDEFGYVERFGGIDYVADGVLNTYEVEATDRSAAIHQVFGQIAISRLGKMSNVKGSGSCRIGVLGFGDKQFPHPIVERHVVVSEGSTNWTLRDANQ